MTLFALQTMLPGMEQQENYYDIMETLLRVVTKFHALDKNQRDFGTGEKLYMPEIHAIAAIGNQPGINISAVAEKLGVTKGTISPLISKLAERNYVVKYKDGNNNRDTLLQLTAKGRIAYHGHEMFHLKLHARLFEQFEDQPEFLRQLQKFFAVGEGILDSYLDQGTLE